MNYNLLDTHVLLWFYNADSRLSENAKTIINTSSTPCFISIASLWEIVIKKSIGKLKLDISLQELEAALQEDALQIMNINPSHLWKLEELPLHHRDPFDRLIIAQAQAEKLKIITKDRQFNAYDVEVIW